MFFLGMVGQEKLTDGDDVSLLGQVLYQSRIIICSRTNAECWETKKGKNDMIKAMTFVRYFRISKIVSQVKDPARTKRMNT